MAFRGVLRDRHVVLVDQRGTGGSNPLACRESDGVEAANDEAGEFDRETAQAAARQCLDGLEADARFYTTSEAVLDLEDVRAAIGADAINLVGISYGTRVAQEYLRRYPARTRTVVLDGVVPPPLVLGAEHARNLDAALALQFARCEADARCSQQFGSPKERLDELLAGPDDLELRALYRLGYVPEQAERPVIDWSSRERRPPSQFVFRETCRTPQRGWDEDGPAKDRTAEDRTAEDRTAEGRTSKDRTAEDRTAADGGPGS